MSKQKNIISPFMPVNSYEKFLVEIEKVAKKYGYSQIFIAYAEPSDEKSAQWNASSNMISEGMIEYLEDIIIPNMKEKLEEDN